MIYHLLKKIGIHSIIYGIGNMSYAIPGFILIPVYTRFLVPAEYGVFSLLASIFGILLYVYELGMVGSLSRRFYDYNDSYNRKKVASTALFFITAYSIVVTGILCFFAKDISSVLFKTTLYRNIVILGLLAAFFQALIFIPQTVIRLNQKPLLYVALSLGRIFFLIGFTILFLVVLKKGLLGLYQALLLVSIAAFIIYITATMKNFKFNFSFFELKHLLYLGLAFFPALLLTWIIESSDRYILSIFTDLSTVGIYSIGYKIGQVSMLLIKSFYLAWIPIIFSIVKLDNASRIFGKIGTYFVLFSALFIFSVSIFAKELIWLLTSNEYASAYKIIFIISLAYLFYGLYIYFLTGVTIKKKLYSLPIVLAVGAILNIGLNILLIPRFGISGAAIATLASYMVVAFLTYFFSQRNYYIIYEIKKIAKIIIFGVLFYSASIILVIENVYLSIGSKLGFLCAYIGVLYLTGIIARDDIKKLKSVFAKATK